MIKIKSISNEDEIHNYVLNILPSIHNELIGFFYKLKFPSDEVDKLDVIFSEINGAYFHIKNEDMKVHFFVHNDEINMVIDSNKSQEELTNLMRMHFIFPR
jgi:hypothetical protein